MAKAAESKLLKELRAELSKVSDPKKASQMQAYMKSKMPYHGVPAPIVKKVCRKLFSEIEISDFETWRNHVLDLWRKAKFREERYGALYFAGISRAKSYQTFEAMDTYEEMIVTGAWWDYVDDIAIHRVGTVLANHPKPTQSLMLSWSRSPDIWKRRSSIICQIGAKEKTKLDFLYKCIEPSMESDEFFLRKAIGWALRQVARRDPDEVVRYVKSNHKRLSPLSKREALKNLIKEGKITAVP